MSLWTSVRVTLQGLYKNPKNKVISMGIESFCWANYPFFSSEAWQFFVSFLLRYWSPYSDIDEMIQETKMSYV